jgi:hypothetical protein
MGEIVDEIRRVQSECQIVLASPPQTLADFERVASSLVDTKMRIKELQRVRGIYDDLKWQAEIEGCLQRHGEVDESRLPDEGELVDFSKLQHVLKAAECPRESVFFSQLAATVEAAEKLKHDFSSLKWKRTVSCDLLESLLKQAWHLPVEKGLYLNARQMSEGLRAFKQRVSAIKYPIRLSEVKNLLEEAAGFPLQKDDDVLRLKGHVDAHDEWKSTVYSTLFRGVTKRREKTLKEMVCESVSEWKSVFREQDGSRCFCRESSTKMVFYLMSDYKIFISNRSDATSASFCTTRAV